MTERQHQPDPTGDVATWSAPPVLPAAELLRDQTVPLPPVPAGEAEPSILGFPAEFPDDAEPQPSAGGPATDAAGPGSAVRLTVLRRADRVGGGALVLAGVAAAQSLWLPWRRGDGATGLGMVRRGIALLGSGVVPVGRSGLWQPLAVVLGGGALLLLGLLLFRPARSHRLVGLLALLVAVAAAAGVVVPFADADWRTAPFGPGTWCAAVVAGLGVLGALKAMLTAPLVRIGPRSLR